MSEDVPPYRSWDIYQAAEFLKIHPDTCTRRAKAGLIPGCKIGRAWVFMPDLLADYVRAQAMENVRQQGVPGGGLASKSLGQRLAAQRAQRLAGKETAAKRSAISTEGNARNGHGRFLPGYGRPSLK
jgi:hypothetical protein